MRKTLITGALVASLTCLAGCSDSDDDGELEAIITNTLLNGDWLKCENEPPGSMPASFSVLLTLNNGDASGDLTEYATVDCDINNIMLFTANETTFMYTVGDAFTLDGTIDGITEGAEVNIVDGQDTLFSSIAVNNLTDLYFGDDGVDPAKDGSTTDKRPTKLDPIPFIKQ